MWLKNQKELFQHFVNSFDHSPNPNVSERNVWQLLKQENIQISSIT